MNILFFHRWTGVRGGGTETHLKGLLNNFSNEHNIMLLTREGPKRSLLEKDFKHVKLFTVSKNLFENDNSYENPVFLYTHTFLFMIKSFFKLVYLIKIKQIKVDIISTHFATEAVVARLFRFLFGTPFIFIFEGYTDLEGNVARFANDTISITHYISSRCQEKYGYYPDVIYIGEGNFPIISKEKIEQKYNQNQTTVLTLCRLEPRKNLFTAIKSIDYIINQRNRKDINFVWGGTGILKDSLMESIKEHNLQNHIKYLGYVNEEDVVDVYQNSHIYFLPTYEEGFGIVYLEAMKSGSVNVSTNKTATPEIIGNVGLLVDDPENYKEFANCILKLIDDRKLWRDMALKGIEKSKDFTWEKLVPKYEAKYQNVANKTT